MRSENLYGISARFRALSHTYRQVSHVLLTRPPLFYGWCKHQREAFDLHVLGLPPAVVLSQDQTLILKVVLAHYC